MIKNVDAAADSLKAALPSSLDDIIRLNRDKFQMRLATGYEIKDLPLLIEVMGSDPMEPKSGEISEWRYVVIDIKDGEQTSFMVGYRHNNTFITSKVVAIEHNGETGFVRTKNSLYRLGKQGDGEPDFHLLMHICASLWVWGAGPSMGVPQVFY